MAWLSWRRRPRPQGPRRRLCWPTLSRFGGTSLCSGSRKRDPLARAQPLGEQRQPRDALVIVERRIFGRRGCGGPGALHTSLSPTAPTRAPLDCVFAPPPVHGELPDAPMDGGVRPSPPGPRDPALVLAWRGRRCDRRAAAREHQRRVLALEPSSTPKGRGKMTFENCGPRVVELASDLAYGAVGARAGRASVCAKSAPLYSSALSVVLASA